MKENDTIEFENIDDLMCKVLKVDKMTYRVPDTKDEDVIIGKSFYYLDTKTEKVDKLTITHIRSGVVFYVSELYPKEDYFPIGCIFQRHLEPEFYETDEDPKYNEIKSLFGKTIITYKQ